MTRRLATICFVTIILIGFSSPSVQSQDTVRTRTTLKGVSAVCVLVETLPEGATILGLTKESIQTDVELKLRLAGMRVVTEKAVEQLPGMPSLYVNLIVTDTAKAAYIEVELDQNVRLDRNDQLAIGVATWEMGTVFANPNAQVIRDKIKDIVDQFLNAWLSVNPKK